jgi:eukaryotic-like serine/threonine-protein kinase
VLEVETRAGRLIVSRGPSASYKALTCAAPVVAAVALLVAAGSRDEHRLDAAFGDLGAWTWPVSLAIALAVGFGLLRGWRRTAYQFDRPSHALVIEQSGPVWPRQTRRVSLSGVSTILDRRGRRGRSIELILSDGETLAIARAREPVSPVLDGIARDVGALLGKPVQLARGVLIAERFEIDRVVARGGMGLVYRALDRTSRRSVALKLMLDPDQEGASAERFEREIEVLADLAHPRIARYVGHGTAGDGQRFLAMQWLEGEDLASALSRGRMALDDSLRVLQGAAEAIAAVHARGVIHRDLKPSNLFLCNRSAAELVLLDFGVARRLSSETRVTASTTILGTPHYMAPEQASSVRDIRPAADVFSLGCIFYECLTGRHPFDAPQLFGVLGRILFDNPEPVTALRPDVPAPWAALLTRMLAKASTQRPADGGELLRELALLPLPHSNGEPAGAMVAGPTDGQAGTDEPPVLETPAARRDSSDQVLVCALLAIVPGSGAEAAGSAPWFESIQSAMNRFGCPIERLADGSLLATVLPRSSATDQVRVAASCALQLRERLPRARIAMATGRAMLRGTMRVGDAIDRAARLLDGAGVAEGIHLDEVSAGLLDSRFATVTRDGQVLLIAERPDLDESRLLLGRPTPCVGRELELIQLESLMSSAVEDGRPRVAVVTGAPGIGKSRLRHELVRRLQDRHPDCAILIGQGDPLNAGSPYLLIGDALRRHAGIRAGAEPTEARAAIAGQLCRNIDPAARRRVAEFLGELCGVSFDADDSPPLQAARADHRIMSEQISAAFFEWLAAECGAQPVLLVLEDAHWGDALTVKALENCLRDLERGRVYVIVLGRPELDQTFPDMLARHRNLSLSLRALAPKACELLVRDVLGDSVGGDTLAKLVRLAGGNALFLEELIRAAADGKAGEIPETVLAMLQARLSRLSSEERLVLRAASVLGETFWQGGVTRICEAWGFPGAPEPCLVRLTELELLARQRTSQYAGDMEYAFRHSLVCEAAHGLSTEQDSRAGHRAAGQWLEEMGETSGVVLARHAELAADHARAIDCYARAAEHSLSQYDFGEALQRAERGIQCGAQGQALGMLRVVKVSALRSMSRWSEAAEVGFSALELLSPGSVYWCAAVEQLLQVLPHLGEFERSGALSDELLRVVPVPEARPSYLRALDGQLLGLAVSGAYARGQACLDFIEKQNRESGEQDALTQGSAGLWRAFFSFMLGDDLPLALAAAQQSVRDLGQAQVLYRLTRAHTTEGFIWWGLGDSEKSEQATARGKAIADQVRDVYQGALASWYRSVSLAEQTDPAKLEEAEKCARALVAAGVNVGFASSAYRIVTARVALTRGDWTTAEADGRTARAGLVRLPPFWLMACAHLLTALARQGRGKEAAELATEDLQRLDRLGCPVCSEVLFRVAAAEALFEGDQIPAAHVALREALQRIEVRSSKIADADMKRSYLGREENRRAFDLAHDWLGVRAADQS